MALKTYKQQVLKIAQATSVVQEELIQSLWSGYGKILRVTLQGSKYPSVIVKLITPPDESNHPRGWNTDLSHQRKLRSYMVEEEWYKNYNKVSNRWRIPRFIGAASKNSSRMIIMEDLDATGFDLRKNSLSLNEVESCLSWLAHFHADHMGVEPVGLWQEGTYWHLDTRPDEFRQMKEGRLKQNARKISQILKECKYQTFVHGDAKLANFCFSDKGDVAAVDFQYVGGGCGMKDVAYFLGSCLDEKECEQYEMELLDHYFNTFREGFNGSDSKMGEIEQEWRYLYPFAWADFARFLAGWMPTHHKLNDYSDKMVEKVLQEII